MSQNTFSSAGTQLAEPPAPILPAGDTGNSGDDNRRKLALVGAAVGILVLIIVGFFLLKGGGSSTSSDAAAVLPHHSHNGKPIAAAQPPVVKLPKHVSAPVGRDPFKALYVATAAGPAAPAAPAGPSSASQQSSSASQQSSGGSTSTTTSSSGTGTSTAPTYHPVWVQFKSISGSTATFDVGFSNGKTLKAVRYAGVKVLHTFAGSFELLSIRSGVVSVRYGDGTPFQLDKTHNSMVVG